MGWFLGRKLKCCFRGWGDGCWAGEKKRCHYDVIYAGMRNKHTAVGAVRFRRVQ